ncbi:MAG: LysR family transcriptional regulator [Gemmobacter sp.]
MAAAVRRGRDELIGGNLRHLRVYLAVTETGSVTPAAERARMSQPAVTQAMTRLTALAGAPLLVRAPEGFVPTEAGRILERRARRAFGLLDAALAEVAGRLVLTARR